MFYDKSVSVLHEDGKKISLGSLAVPLLFENIFVLMYGTINTWILSGYSDIAVSATGVAQQVSNLVVVILGMISKGAVIVTSQALGSQNKKRVETVAGSGMFLTLFGSLFFAGILGVFSDTFMRMMNLNGSLKLEAVKYLRTVGFVMPITAMQSYFNNLLICHGFSGITMLSGLLSNGLNIVLCYVALYCNLSLPVGGVTAVALCGGIAQAVGLAVSLFFFIYKKCDFRLKVERKATVDVLKFGIPAGMSLLSYSLSQTVTTRFITDLGVSVINTKLYVSNILQYTSRVSYSMGNAGGILVGRHRGAGRIDEIKQLFKQNVFLALFCNVGVSLVVLVFSKQLLGIFTDDAKIIASGTMIIAIDIIAEAARAVNHISENAFNANGDVKTPLITAAASAWGCNVLLSFLFAVVLKQGIVGLWIATITDECFKASVYLLRWRKGAWQKIKV